MAQVSGLTENGESNAMIDELRYLSLQFERISAIGVQLSSIVSTIAAELGCSYEFVAEIVNDLLKATGGDIVIDVSDIPRAISPNCKTNAYLKWREDSSQRRQLSFEQLLTGSGSRKTGYKRIKASAGSILLTGLMLDINRIKWVRNTILARYQRANGMEPTIAASATGNLVSTAENGSYYLFPRLPTEQEYVVPKLVIDPRTHTQFLFEEEDFTQLIRVSMAAVLWRAYAGDEESPKGGSKDTLRLGKHTISNCKTDYTLPPHLQHRSTMGLDEYVSDDELDCQQTRVIRRLCDETPILSGARYIHATAEQKRLRHECYLARVHSHQQGTETGPIDGGEEEFDDELNPGLRRGRSEGRLYHVPPITGLDFKLLRQDVLDVELGHVPQHGMLVRLAKSLLEVREQRSIRDEELVQMANTLFKEGELEGVFTSKTAEWLRRRMSEGAGRRPVEEGSDEHSNELDTCDARLSRTSRLQIPRLYWFDQAKGRMYVEGFNDLEDAFAQRGSDRSGFDAGKLNAIEFSRAYARAAERALLNGQSEISFVDRDASGALLDRQAYESTDRSILASLLGQATEKSIMERARPSALAGGTSCGGHQQTTMGYNDCVQRILTAIPAARVDYGMLRALASIPLDVLQAILSNCLVISGLATAPFVINNLTEVVSVIPDVVHGAHSRSLEDDINCIALLQDERNGAQVIADGSDVSTGMGPIAFSALGTAVKQYGLSGLGAAPGYADLQVGRPTDAGRADAVVVTDALMTTVSAQLEARRAGSCPDYFTSFRSVLTDETYSGSTIMRIARSNSVAAPTRIQLEEDMISLQLLAGMTDDAIDTSLLASETEHLVTTGHPKNLERYNSVRETAILEHGIDVRPSYVTVNGQQQLRVTRYAAPILSHFNQIDPGAPFFSPKHYDTMIPVSDSICSAIYSGLIPSYTGTSRFLEQVSDLWKGSADAFLGSCASVSSVYSDQSFYSIKIIDPSTTTLIALAARAEVLRRKAALSAPGFNETKGMVPLRHDCRSLWRSTGACPIVVMDREDREELLGRLGRTDSDGEDADFDEISALGPFDATQSGKPDVYLTHTYQFVN
ncbi:hypothetical protein GMRT_14064 [Giardia muris]|uniref:Uncharacterized protein n=1 Tax=Giardia muris TaxID=5742 RepID=A0A4Z1T278_GIAMU|nr:hypothetical protein GMRT_14064 [Giardia muris]|eukprot:TNJ26689.1 hypothetical protein GMRT_14064 [Giardia muris]